jgi:predicted protein tyrosine phosphatase
MLQVCSLRAAENKKRRFDAVLSLESPRAPRRERLRFHAQPAPDHLVLRFEDLDYGPAGVTLPTREHARLVLEFGRKHVDAKLLVHCVAGVGRSPAAALLVLADRYGPGREADALDELLRLRPEAVPNLALTAAADAELGRGGALHSVVVARNSTRDDWQTVRARKQAFFECFPDTFA